MRSLNLPETQCGCESGEHFKCYCSELKENTPSKLKKRLSSCKNFIKGRSKKSYGNVINVDDDGNLLRSQSVTLASTYTIKKDLKDLLHITSKKVLEPCVDLEDSQNSSSGGSKSASASSLRSSHESIASKQSSNGSIKSKRSSSKSSSKTPPPTPMEAEHRCASRRDSNESIDARFEIVLPS